MTDPIVSLDVDRIAVEPGGQVSVTIKIANPGTIVEGYRVEVIGEGVSDWGEALPPEISIYPQQDASAVVVFSPPGGTGAPGGTWPFGVRVRSTEDADASAVVEGDLEIGKVFGLQAKLLPVNSSGRWRGRHVIQLSNWGNSPAKLRLTASNQDEALGFLIRPDVVELALGGTGTAMLWAKTKKPTLRGTQTRIAFTVTGEQVDAPAQQGPVSPYGGTPDRPTVDGAFNQKPILTAGAVMLLALVLLAVGGGVAWALTRPQPAQATFQEMGPPETPSEVKVEPTGPDSVRVGWKAVPNVSGYRVVQVLPDDSRTGSKDVPMTNTAETMGELTPATNVCFAVQAVRGDLSSPPSTKVCADTPAVQSTVTPSPSGQPSSSAPASVPPSVGGESSAGGGAGGAGGGAGGAGGGEPSTSTSGEPTSCAVHTGAAVGWRRHRAEHQLQGQVVRDRLLAGAGDGVRRGGQVRQARGSGRARGSGQQQGLPDHGSTPPGGELDPLPRAPTTRSRKPTPRAAQCARSIRTVGPPNWTREGTRSIRQRTGGRDRRVISVKPRTSCPPVGWSGG